MKLVLIEGPGKKEAVSKYLGKDYKVVATGGHVRDLPEKKLGVDIHADFKPEYVIMPEKKKVVDLLKKEATKAEKIFFATDPDREGEAIAWHLSNILGVDPNSNCRISYNEISKKAVQNAIEKPHAIDANLVDAQQARRVLDRLVGYKLSPLLCKKIQGKLSAGRVQSVTLKLVVDRDREIENFVPEEFWSISAELEKNDKKFKAALVLPKNKKISNKEQAETVLKELENAKFVVSSVKRATKNIHAPAPFRTSDMQKDAQSKLAMNLKTTTAVAQTLYEGVDVSGEGKVALVTYIRTDSVRVAPDAQKSALDYIGSVYGTKYVPKIPNIYKGKKGAQDAHEAIRPISLDRTPESIKGKVQPNQYKLYKLIYERFVASQMADAKYDCLNVEIMAGNYLFKASGKTMIFDGYTRAYQTKEIDDDESNEINIPNLQENDELVLDKLIHEQKFTKPPARYNEGSLVDDMEKKGIGRPATYAQTVGILLSRSYVKRDGKSLISTDLGRRVVDLLVKFFKDIMNIKFTAEMEDKLDTIEDGGKNWQKIVSDFYFPFEKELKEAFADNFKDKIPDEISDVVCEKCGTNMVIKNGKYGKFLACPNYPSCKNTKQIIEKVCKCPKCNGEIIKKVSKSGKIFYGCSNYPKCDFSTWDIPTKYKCPECGSVLFLNNFKGKKIYKCIKCSFAKEEKKKEDGEVVST